MSAPANGHLGTSQLFKEGDLVLYTATPYWQTTVGTWYEVEGMVGEITEVRFNHNYANSPLADIHPFSYHVLFPVKTTPIMPAPENLHPVAGRESAWEL
jgi:hypothetical protein